MNLFDLDVMQTMKFDIVDQYSLRVECFHHDLLEGDTIIGRGECSLLPAFKQGKFKARSTYQSKCQIDVPLLLSRDNHPALYSSD